MFGFGFGYCDMGRGCNCRDCAMREYSLYADENDGGNYGRFREKSDAATRRESAAAAAFDRHRTEVESKACKGKQVHQLLTPKEHLTSACWTSFSRHVRRSAGWNVKRRVANEEERRASKVTRKSKVYFVDVIFTPPKDWVPKSLPKGWVPKSAAAPQEKKKKKQADDDEYEPGGSDDDYEPGRKAKKARV